MSKPVAVIGYILLVPSVAGMLLGILFFATVLHVAGGDRGAGVVGGGIAGFWIIVCFVGGLLGWLLVMKRRVLQCTVCGATVSAS